MYCNTEASKRLIQMNPSCSQSTFRDSARQALQAQKQQDGTLRISTPFQDVQSKKVANLKQKLTQLNMSSSVRCQSNLHNSSSASVTAATTYLPRGSGVDQSIRQSGYQNRPNSNISNMLDSRSQLDKQKNHITDLTRFSQNSVSNDLSPLRVSNLNQPDHSRKKSNGRKADIKYNGAHSVIQDPRKRSSLGFHQTNELQTPVSNQQQISLAARNFEHIRKSRNEGSTDGRINEQTGTIYRSASFPRANSCRSVRTNQSSPERLVNIVCPPSKGPKNRLNGQRIIPSAKATRPRSDMRHNQFSNSFQVTTEDNQRNNNKERLVKQLHALGNQYGISTSSQSQFLSNKRLGVQNYNSNQNYRKMVTPTKARKSLAGGSRSKSKSHSRLGMHKSANECSTPGLSSKKKSLKKINQKMNKLSNKDSRKLGMCRKAISRNSMRSRSARSVSRSSNSNMKEGIERRSDGQNNRDERRANKYLKNQTNNSSVKKSFNFASIEAQNTIECLNEPQVFARPPSGQVTGKFRSLNEPIMNSISAATRFQNKNANQKKLIQQQQVMFTDQMRSLKTEDDYCETLTASSEESPLRPSQRVQRAAALTTKAYLEDVNQRVDNANHHAQSVREFGPRKMKAAYQGINERQGARLQCLKQQMQDSLIETHQLQAKLQNSSTGEENGNRQVRRAGGVSQFNSLVLEFSQNLENKAAELIEMTESKQKNLRMKEMIAELQETRKHRSGSKSMPTSARRLRPQSNQNSARKLRRSRSKSSVKSGRSMSARSNRSQRSSSRKSNISRKGRKRSKSARRSTKRLGSQRSKSKSKSVRIARSVRSRRSLSKSARSARSARSLSSARGRSHSHKKIKSVKRNIFESTNGFRDVGQNIPLKIKSGQIRQKSRKTRSKSNKSRSKSVQKIVSGHKVSAKPFSRVKELAKKCERLMDHKVKEISRSKMTRSKRSLSKKKLMKSNKASKSRSKSRKKVILRRKVTKSRSKSARSKSAKKRQSSTSKSPINGGVRRRVDVTPKVTPKYTPQVTPCMTPLHNILRNSMGDHDMSDMALRGQMNRFGSMAQNKKVKICSRRLQDITQLTSSDSDSSYDSEDSMDNERYLKRQQAHLSPWQRACIRKQLPKKFR